MRPSNARSLLLRVYSFYKIATVDAESLNNATDLLRKNGANPSNAILTAFNSLNVMCYDASIPSNTPLTNDFGPTVEAKCAPAPKSEASVNNSSCGAEISHDEAHYVNYNYDQ